MPTAIDELVANNASFTASFGKGDLQIRPAKPVAILTCIDARVDPARMLGLELGDAHVIRNAGGQATVDALRSIAISQHLLGTTEVMVIHHTDCGMTKFNDKAVADQIENATGVRPPETLGFVSDVESSLKDTVATIQGCGYLKSREAVRGFVYQVENGRLRAVV